MTDKTFSIRTSNEKMQNFLDKKESVSDYLRNLIELDMKGKIFLADDIEKENKVLKNLKLKLDIWKDLKSEGFTLEKAYNIFKGHNVPELPTIEKLQESFNKQESQSFDPSGFCLVCTHRHTDTEPRICTDLHCNCGVR